MSEKTTDGKSVPPKVLLAGGPRLNESLMRYDHERRGEQAQRMMECVKCGRMHKPPRRGDSITCECGLVFW